VNSYYDLCNQAQQLQEAPENRQALVKFNNIHNSSFNVVLFFQIIINLFGLRVR